jgi:hypothetical protein
LEALLLGRLLLLDDASSSAMLDEVREWMRLVPN